MGAAALIDILGIIFTLIIVVALVSIFIVGSEGLPTGSEFFSVLPVAFVHVGEGFTSLSLSL